MKKYIVITFGLLFASCASLSTQTLSDSIIIERKERSIEFYTESFKNEKLANYQTNVGGLKFELIPGNYKEDILSFLGKSLSKQNFEIFKGLSGYTAFQIGLVVDQDKRTYGGFSASIFNRNINELNLSEAEMKDILKYLPEFARSIKYHFYGNYPPEFKTVISFVFPINKRKPSEN